MCYFPFLYHTLNRIYTIFNHFSLHKDKYNVFPCFTPFLSHESVTHKHPLSDLMSNAS